MDLASLTREALAHERQTNSWTIEQQAAHHKIDPVSIYRWERGIMAKSAEILIPLVIIFKQTKTTEQAA